MSLRSFHIVFITISVLLSLGFALFEFDVFRQGHTVIDLVLGSIGAVVGVLLACYGVSFVRKSRRLA